MTKVKYGRALFLQTGLGERGYEFRKIPKRKQCDVLALSLSIALKHLVDQLWTAPPSISIHVSLCLDVTDRQKK